MATFVETYRAKAHGTRVDECPGAGHYCRPCALAAQELIDQQEAALYAAMPIHFKHAPPLGHDPSTCRRDCCKQEAGR